MVENEKTREKLFPKNFKTDFSRLIKVLMSKKKGWGEEKIMVKEVKRA